METADSTLTQSGVLDILQCPEYCTTVEAPGE